MATVARVEVETGQGPAEIDLLESPNDLGSTVSAYEVCLGVLLLLLPLSSVCDAQDAHPCISASLWLPGGVLPLPSPRLKHW